MRDLLQTAVNDEGYETDIIRRATKDDDPHPLQISADKDDLWAMQASFSKKKFSGRRFSQLVVASSGTMAQIKTLHPLDFIGIKTALWANPQRDRSKQPKDKLQAQVVQSLLDHHGLQHVADAQTKPGPP